MTLRFTRSRLAGYFATALIAFAAAGAGRASASEQAEFDNALKLYRQAKFAAAYGRFSALADRGHPEAARIALFMLRYGSPLFGSAWSASQDQIDGCGSSWPAATLSAWSNRAATEREARNAKCPRRTMSRVGAPDGP